MAITKFLDPKNDVAFRRIFGSEKNKAAEDYLIKTAKAEGEARGKAELVKMMLNNGGSIESISKITGLSIARINELLKMQ
jgi:hypothetical protein